MAMTCHVVFNAWDPDRPATLSSLIVDSVIRRRIGFHGLLVTDDLDMKALSGDVPARAAAAIAAGCDIALNCWGRMDDMIGIARALDPIGRSEEHTSELQSLMRISYAVFCLN